MFGTKLHIIIVGLVLITVVGCKKESHPPTAPEIRFEDFSFAQDSTTGFLTFYYHDLNGDIGLKEQETEPPFPKDIQAYHNTNEKTSWITLHIQLVKR